MEYTPSPCNSMMAPLFPVPNRTFPFGEKPMEKTRSSREVQSVSGEPAGDIFTTCEPPVVEGKSEKAGGGCAAAAARGARGTAPGVESPAHRGQGCARW